jgi:hypothetical protein
LLLLLCSLAGLSVAATVSPTICSAECWAGTVADATLHQLAVTLQLPAVVEIPSRQTYAHAVVSFLAFVVEESVADRTPMLVVDVMHPLEIAAIQVVVAD